MTETLMRWKIFQVQQSTKRISDETASDQYVT